MIYSSDILALELIHLYEINQKQIQTRQKGPLKYIKNFLSFPERCAPQPESAQVFCSGGEREGSRVDRG